MDASIYERLAALEQRVAVIEPKAALITNPDEIARATIVSADALGSTVPIQAEATEYTPAAAIPPMEVFGDATLKCFGATEFRIIDRRADRRSVKVTRVRLGEIIILVD
jgi:hypothetical protein